MMKDKLRQVFGAFGIDMNQFSIEKVQDGKEELFYLESKKGFSAASRYPMVYFSKEMLGEEEIRKLMRVEIPNQKRYFLIDLTNESYSVPTTKHNFNQVIPWYFFEAKGVDLYNPSELVSHIKRETR